METSEAYELAVPQLLCPRRRGLLCREMTQKQPAWMRLSVSCSAAQLTGRQGTIGGQRLPWHQNVADTKAFMRFPWPCTWLTRQMFCYNGGLLLCSRAFYGGLLVMAHLPFWWLATGSLELFLRLGAHWLSVVTGRWINGGNQRGQRYCKNCRACAVEDEKHFLMECPAYHAIRDDFQELYFYLLLVRSIKQELYDDCGGDMRKLMCHPKQHTVA